MSTDIYIIWSIERAGEHILILLVKSRHKSSGCVTSISLHVHQGYEICCLCLCTVGHTQLIENEFFSPPAFLLLFGFPLRPSWPLVQHTTTEQLTLKQPAVGVNLSCADCPMPRSWPRNNSTKFFSFILGETCATTPVTRSRNNKLKWGPSRRSSINLKALSPAGLRSPVSFSSSRLVMQFENVSACASDCLWLHFIQWRPLPHTMCQPAWDSHLVTISASPI